jgi:hypothetical protein
MDCYLAWMQNLPSNLTGNPVGDPMTMTPAMNPAKWLAYGRANTVTVRESNTHERASCGDKMQVIAPINTGHETGIFSSSMNSGEDSTKETLVVEHIETSISEREKRLS